MVRKKAKKSRKRLLNLGIQLESYQEKKPKTKGKKRLQKPAMPARIKKTPRK